MYRYKVANKVFWNNCNVFWFLPAIFCFWWCRNNHNYCVHINTTWTVCPGKMKWWWWCLDVLHVLCDLHLRLHICTLQYSITPCFIWQASWLHLFPLCRYFVVSLPQLLVERVDIACYPPETNSPDQSCSFELVVGEIKVSLFCILHQILLETISILLIMFCIVYYLHTCNSFLFYITIDGNIFILHHHWWKALIIKFHHFSNVQGLEFIYM